MSKAKGLGTVDVTVEVDAEDVLDDNFDCDDIFSYLLRRYDRADLWDIIKDEFAKEIQEDDEE